MDAAARGLGVGTMLNRASAIANNNLLVDRRNIAFMFGAPVLTGTVDAASSAFVVRLNTTSSLLWQSFRLSHINFYTLLFIMT